MPADSLNDLLPYFEPPDGFSAGSGTIGISQSLGDQIGKNGQKDQISPDEAEIFILGAPKIKGSQEIRQHLYRMGGLSAEKQVFDLGDFRNGKNTADTLSGWKDVLFELGRKQKILIILGNNPEGISHTLQAVSRLEHPINLSVVSPDIHLVNEPSEVDATYLNRLLTDPESQLFDYVHLGYQSYFCDPGIAHLLDKLYFSHIRLGELRANLREAEPHLRNSDMVAFSLAAIRQSDAPGTRTFSANGLYAEEACQLARYAGLSDKLYVLHLFDLPEEKNQPVSANLAAQLIWHFIQAAGQRRKDYPFAPISAYSKYIVSIPGADHEINFYKSKDADRWWMEVPYPSTKYHRALYVACTANDYHHACNGEIPDKWLKNYQRIS